MPSRAVTRTQGDGEVPEVDPNMELPLHETSVEAMFRPPDEADFNLPPTLGEQVKGKPLIAKTMPRQTEINNLMKHLNRKILSKTRFPSSLKDLEAAYCSSEAFKDIYQFLRFNKLPTSRRLAKRIEANAQDYYVLGSILFKYIPQKSGEIDAVMCIPPSKVRLHIRYVSWNPDRRTSGNEQDNENPEFQVLLSQNGRLHKSLCSRLSYLSTFQEFKEIS